MLIVVKACGDCETMRRRREIHTTRFDENTYYSMLPDARYRIGQISNRRCTMKMKMMNEKRAFARNENRVKREKLSWNWRRSCTLSLCVRSHRTLLSICWSYTFARLEIHSVQLTRSIPTPRLYLACWFSMKIFAHHFLSPLCVCVWLSAVVVSFILLHTHNFILQQSLTAATVFTLCVCAWIYHYLRVHFMVNFEIAFFPFIFFLPRFYICVLIVYRSGCFTFVPLVSFSLFLSDYTPREHHSALEFLHYLLCHIAWLFRQ